MYCVRENACHETPKKLEVVAGLEDKGLTAKVNATLGREMVAMVRMIGCMEIAPFAFPGSRRWFDHALVPSWLEIMTDPNRPEQRAPDNSRTGGGFRRTTKTKPNVDIYGRFEQGVALVLLLLVSSVIVVGLAHLVLRVKWEVFLPLDTPLEPDVFKDIFGATLTVLIGLELNHTV